MYTGPVTELNERELKFLFDRLISLRISIESELEDAVENRGEIMRELRAVRRACRKLEQGDEFGLCERCGDWIGYGALKMEPAKQECWRCDQEREKLRDHLDKE